MVMAMAVGGVVNPIPLAPTLLTPENGSYEDLSGTPTFTWQYNAGAPSSGTVQTAYQFQRITNGGTTQYWNATAEAWQSTTVKNTSTAQSVTFSSGAWVDGNVYQWSVATTDANGDGPFAQSFTVNSQALPTVTSITPNGTITTADPVIAWVAGFPTGATQTTYQVIIYDATQYSASGFAPGSGPSVYDTGVVGGSASSIDLSQVPVLLPNSTSYRFYVQIGETGGQVSTWVYSPVVTSYAAPNIPEITATPTPEADTDPRGESPTYPSISLVFQGNDNLLSQQDADPALGLGTWREISNCAVASTSDGLSLTASAAGNMSAETVPGTAGYAVQSSTQYSAVADFQATTSGRSCTVAIAWYDATGALISTSTGTAITDTTAGATQASVTATSPSSAAFATVVLAIDSAAASELHYVSEIGILLGSSVTWGPGGFVGLQEAIVLRSDGLYVRGASPANPASLDAATQQVTLADYEATPGVSYSYAAQVIVTYAKNQTVVSDPGDSASVTQETLGWWEVDPTNPDGAIYAQPTSWNPLQVEQSAAHMVTGLQTMNIVANAMMRQDFNATFTIFDNSTYAVLESLVASQITCFVSSPWGSPDSNWYRFGPQSGGLSTGTGNKTKDTTLHASAAPAGYRDVAVTAVAQPRPPV